MQKIMPFLWFDDQAEAAISFYISVFKDAKILELQRYPAEGGEKEADHPGQHLDLMSVVDD